MNQKKHPDSYTQEIRRIILSGEKEPEAFSKQQLLFAKGKDRIKRLTDEDGNPIDEKARREIDTIGADLYGAIYSYSCDLISTITLKYRKSSDTLQDIHQDIALKFFEKLDSYDPSYCSPTTFFKSYFLEAISQHLQKYSQHLKQNDANNLAKVRKACRELGEKVALSDITLICERTGLSPKVVKNTLMLANNSIYADIDDVIDIASKIPSPETQCIRAISSETFITAIKNTLSEYEYNFLLYRIDLDGNGTLRTYKDVMAHFNISSGEAKRTWDTIIKKLQQNQTISAYGCEILNLVSPPSLDLHSDTGDMMQADIIEALTDDSNNN